MSKPSDQLKEASVLQPKSWDDYVSFAGWMIYKKLLIALLVIIALLLACILALLLKPKPEPESTGIPVYYYFDELLKLYSGEVIIINEADKTIYQGQVQNGLRSGWGKHLFPVDGSTIYEGEFRGDVYEGQGILYDSQDVILYQGQFANGLFNGHGVLFEKENKKYEGSFADGLLDGVGVLYDESERIRYQGEFARGMKDGAGLELDADGNPLYEGGFREDMYNGQGTLYTVGGSRLKFEGVFIRGKPARTGKIYNLQGQLLYDGPVLDGKVDCIGLLGLGANDWKPLVMEKPVIYFDSGSVGYLYGELGIAAVGIYSLEPQAPNSVESAEYADFVDGQAESEAKESNPTFSDDDVFFYTMLVAGQNYSEQLPLDESAEIALDSVDGFEDFMSSRLAAIENPLVKLETEAEVKRIDSNTYEVIGLPESVEFDGDAFYKDLIYYYFDGKDLSKGGTADVIHCRKRQFGG